ncbi:hypothetical protein CW745_05245 [Psychromonas sp. psych-6C06]|uniref:methyl-accepting chemotaxis protein n=1 Tax=Psychromonas sp. psych-6C06 TaxID=2058089 RepID=UPI000C34AD19|nr:HAMP domain-containing methyl-accepting chemotaxis protein [Psychromonas sp. psych-6C06]PKF62827.1 hypothetical protein CW745_05245 [Psychromonas sp. psych-6C06]
MNINLTIKEKMYLFAGVVGLVSLAIVALSLSSIQSLHKISTAQNLARQVNSQMLMLRRHEKDFITRKEVKYQERFEESMQLLNQQVTELAVINKALDMPTQSINQLLETFDQYQLHFKRLVEIDQLIGFDHQSGLHGELRESVKNVENQLALMNGDSLLVVALKLRKNEKDFIQRLDLNSITKFNANISLFLQKLDESNLAQQRKTAISSLMKQYQAAFITMTKAYQTRGLTVKEGVLGEMRNSVHQSETLLKETIESTLVLAKKEQAQVEVTITSVALLLSALLVIVLLLMVRNIVGSIERLIKEMNNIATGEGDLRVRLPDQGRDEMSRLSAAFNCFVARIQGVVKEVSDASSSLAGAAEQSAVSVDQTATMLSKQEQETNQIATAIQQMSATVAEVARSASVAAEATEQANGHSLQGKSVLNESSCAIRKLAKEVQLASDVIEKLAERSISIGGILDVIRDVADKTNLLALNAAIEAARAGEQGRGFAVVADEVRALAQRTQSATNEIESMVNGIREGVESATEVMHVSRTSADIVVNQTQQAGIALDSITEGVGTISGLNAQIASASEEQAVVSGELSENVNNINSCAIQTSASAEQIRCSSNELARLSQQLFGLTSQFKV